MPEGFFGTWIGTLASVLGAGVSIWQACRAVNAKKQVEGEIKAFKEQQVVKRQFSELETLLKDNKEAAGIIGYYITEPSGRDLTVDIRKLYEFLAEFKKNAHIFKNSEGETNKSMNNLEDQLSSFSNEQSVKNAKAVHAELIQIGSYLKLYYDDASSK